MTWSCWRGLLSARDKIVRRNTLWTIRHKQTTKYSPSDAPLVRKMRSARAGYPSLSAMNAATSCTTKRTDSCYPFHKRRETYTRLERARPIMGDTFHNAFTLPTMVINTRVCRTPIRKIKQGPTMRHVSVVVKRHQIKANGWK